MCYPGVHQRYVNVYERRYGDNAIPKAKIDNYSRSTFNLPDKYQLVIIEKITPYEVDASRVAQRPTGQRFKPY